MPNSTCCESCGNAIAGRSDKRTCSPKCKRELKLKYDRDRYESIRLKTIDRACRWQRENRDRKQAYDANYREINSEQRLAHKREYGKSHPVSSDYARDRQNRRRARKAHNGVFEITARDHKRLLARYNNKCCYCHTELDETTILEWDHVVPIRRGGAHGIGNIVPSCRTCNRSKSHRLVMEWRLHKVVPRSLTVL